MTRLAHLLLKEQSDVRLLELSAEGHEQAFEVLVRRHTRSLRRLACRIAPDSRADDIVQDTFMRAWLALRAGTEVANPRAWLMRMAANAAMDHHRGRYDFEELRESLEATDGDPAAASERRRMVRDTLTAVAALPTTQREALLRIAVEGASGRDVALELDLSEGAVRQLVHRARSTLRAGFTAVTPVPLLAAAVSPSTAKAAIAQQIAAAVSATGSAGGTAVATKVVAGIAMVAAAGTSVKTVSERTHRDAQKAAPVVQADAPARVAAAALPPGGEDATARRGSREAPSGHAKTGRHLSRHRDRDDAREVADKDRRAEERTPAPPESAAPRPRPQSGPAPVSGGSRNDDHDGDELEEPEERDVVDEEPDVEDEPEIEEPELSDDPGDAP